MTSSSRRRRTRCGKWRSAVSARTRQRCRCRGEFTETDHHEATKNTKHSPVMNIPRPFWLMLLALGVAVLRAQESSMPNAQKLQQMAARFAPTDIRADISKL